MLRISKALCVAASFSACCGVAMAGVGGAPDVRVTCPSSTTIQSKISSAVAGREFVISIAGACTENLYIAPGKVITLEAAVPGASLVPLNKLRPAVSSEGKTTIKRLTISNPSGAADALVMADVGGNLQIYGSTLSAPNVMSVAGFWAHSGGLIKNSRITGGVDDAVSVWEGSGLTIVGTPTDVAGPDGFKTVISNPNGLAVGCGLGSTLVIRAFKSGSASGGVLVNNSRNGIGGGECSAHIRNHTDRVENITITGIAVGGSAISFEKSTMNLINARIANNRGGGINVRMSSVDLAGVEMSNNAAGDISANYDATILFSQWMGRPSSLPNVASGTIGCDENTHIYVPGGSVRQDLSRVRNLPSCVILQD